MLIVKQIISIKCIKIKENVKLCKKKSRIFIRKIAIKLPAPPLPLLPPKSCSPIWDMMMMPTKLYGAVCYGFNSNGSFIQVCTITLKHSDSRWCPSGFGKVPGCVSVQLGTLSVGTDMPCWFFAPLMMTKYTAEPHTWHYDRGHEYLHPPFTVIQIWQAVCFYLITP